MIITHNKTQRWQEGERRAKVPQAAGECGTARGGGSGRKGRSGSGRVGKGAHVDTGRQVNLFITILCFSPSLSLSLSFISSHLKWMRDLDCRDPGDAPLGRTQGSPFTPLPVAGSLARFVKICAKLAHCIYSTRSSNHNPSDQPNIKYISQNFIKLIAFY